MGVTPRSDEDAAHIERSWTENKGEHIIGTGLGAGAGALTGAGIGAAAGPIGIAAGAAIGGIAGGLAGKGAAEVVNPEAGDELHEHHFAKGVGAGSGAAMGAAAGAVGGPIGMAAGAGSRLRAGRRHGRQGSWPHGQSGGRVAYWRSAYQTAPYYTPGYTYDDYGPAYELGYNSRGRYSGRLRRVRATTCRASGTHVKGKSRLSWDQAKSATRAAWHKVERAMPGDSDGDGR